MRRVSDIPFELIKKVAELQIGLSAKELIEMRKDRDWVEFDKKNDFFKLVFRLRETENYLKTKAQNGGSRD